MVFKIIILPDKVAPGAGKIQGAGVACLVAVNLHTIFTFGPRTDALSIVQIPQDILLQ